MAPEGCHHPAVTWLNGVMEEEGRRIPIRTVLVAAGTVGIIIALVGPSFLGEGVGVLFLPALILLFIGRSMNRSRRRRPIDELPQGSPPVPQRRSRRETSSQPTEPQPRREPDSRPKPPPSRTRVDADLEKALAGYRQEQDAQRADQADKPPVVPVDIGFQPKTSAEMIEEAKRRLKESR